MSRPNNTPRQIMVPKDALIGQLQQQIGILQQNLNATLFVAETLVRLHGQKVRDDDEMRVDRYVIADQDVADWLPNGFENLQFRTSRDEAVPGVIVDVIEPKIQQQWPTSDEVEAEVVTDEADLNEALRIVDDYRPDTGDTPGGAMPPSFRSGDQWWPEDDIRP
jgi:hypothetical protein